MNTSINPGDHSAASNPDAVQERPVTEDKGMVSDYSPLDNGYRRAGSPAGISSTSNDNGHGQTMSTSHLMNRVKQTNIVTDSFDSGSAFVKGAGTTEPGAKPDIDGCIQARVAEAEMSSTPKHQKSTIAKSELKEGKGLLKVIKNGAKAEKASLQVAIKELRELQKLQKDAIKIESKVHTSHSKFLSAFQKQELAFYATRTAYEASQTELGFLGESLAMTRRNAREATEEVRGKMKEVEMLRAVMAVDERERGVKLHGTSHKSRMSIFGGSVGK